MEIIILDVDVAHVDIPPIWCYSSFNNTKKVEVAFVYQ